MLKAVRHFDGFRTHVLSFVQIFESCWAHKKITMIF